MVHNLWTSNRVFFDNVKSRGRVETHIIRVIRWFYYMFPEGQCHNFSNCSEDSLLLIPLWIVLFRKLKNKKLILIKISIIPIFYKINILLNRFKFCGLIVCDIFQTQYILIVVICGLIVCDILQTQYILTNLFKTKYIFLAYFSN